MAEALAPDQSVALMKVAQLSSNNSDIRELDEGLNNEVIQNIKQIYDLYVKQKMPFTEQVWLLSLMPRSWSYEKMIDVFTCSRHAIKTAHRMHDEQEYMLKRDIEPAIRQRADPEKVKHFVNWLVESNTLVSGQYRIFYDDCTVFFPSLIIFFFHRYIWSHYLVYDKWRQIRSTKANSSIAENACSY